MRNLLIAAIIAAFSAVAPCPVHANPGDPIHETCPDADDVGTNVECYPVTFTTKTEIHPKGIPLIGYLFVPKERPDGPLPAIVFAHGSGSMYSSGNHNKGLNSTHLQWVRQYTSELGYVGLHVSSFHSRYLLPDTEGDQRILDITQVPQGEIGVGGDDYRATSTLGYAEDENGIPLPYTYLEFDPNQDGWKDASNDGAGVSEVMERAYDMDAARDFLVGIRKGSYLVNVRNDSESRPTRGTPVTGEGFIGEIVTGGLTIDHERVFLYGTSHGGQTAMAIAQASRALNPEGPMNADLPKGSPLKRFAAFFDYYGGCGLHGAYGGTNDSTWQPYAPFLMFHGSLDDEAVFDEDEVPIDSLAEFALTGCGKRIAAAKAAPGFEQFLEAIVYKEAKHSFDGVEREDVNGESDSDFGSWLAKIHANYRITVPFMDAVGRQVSAVRNNENVPMLAELGFSGRLPYFDTVPLSPHLGPQAVPGSQLHNGADVIIDDLTDSQLDLGTLLKNPFELDEMICDGLDITVNIQEPAECLIKFALTAAEIQSDLPDTFWIRAKTARGTTLVPARLEATGGMSGRLVFMQEFHTLPPQGTLAGELGGQNPDKTIDFQIDGFVWTRFPANAHEFKLQPIASGYSTGVDLRNIFGAAPSSPVDVKHSAFSDGNAIETTLSIQSHDDETAGITLAGINMASFDEDRFQSDPLPMIDFTTNFISLNTVNEGGDGGGDIDGAALYAARCASCHGPLDSSERRNRSADQIRAAIDSVPAMQALDFLSDEEIEAIAAALKSESNEVPNPGPDGSTGGGGAFVWLLLPFALALRRRH